MWWLSNNQLLVINLGLTIVNTSIILVMFVFLGDLIRNIKGDKYEV